ncbi:MAG: DUF1428 domain-containing protein [Phycisphaerae bacterium]|nr:DUF1428 domain-containing protein [Phycisphaerae bacterium]
MSYVDGFLLVVPTKKLKDYIRLAKIGRTVWLEHGALDYRECVGDDLDVKFGLPFPKLVKPKKGETIVFSYIRYPSKAARTAINKKVMKDPRLAACMDPKSMPFDMKRMCCGGFKTIVEP